MSAPSSELETAATAGPAAAAVSRQDGDRHSHDPVQQQRQQQQVAGAYQCQELESSGTLVLGRIATADGPSTLTTLTSHEHGHGDEHDTFDMGGATSTNLQLSLMATTAYSTSHANAGTFGTLTHAQLPSSSTLTYPRNARALGLATTTSLVSTAPPSLLQSVLTDGGWAGGDGGGGGSFEPLSSTGVLVVEAADVASSGMHVGGPAGIRTPQRLQDCTHGRREALLPSASNAIRCRPVASRAYMSGMAYARLALCFPTNGAQAGLPLLVLPPTTTITRRGALTHTRAAPAGTGAAAGGVHAEHHCPLHGGHRCRAQPGAGVAGRGGGQRGGRQVGKGVLARRQTA